MKGRDKFDSAQFEELDFSLIGRKNSADDVADEFFISKKKDLATPEEIAKTIVEGKEAATEERVRAEAPVVTSISYTSVEEEGKVSVSYVTEYDGQGAVSDDVLAMEIAEIAQHTESEGFLPQVDALLKHVPEMEDVEGTIVAEPVQVHAVAEDIDVPATMIEDLVSEKVMERQTTISTMEESENADTVTEDAPVLENMTETAETEGVAKAEVRESVTAEAVENVTSDTVEVVAIGTENDVAVAEPATVEQPDKAQLAAMKKAAKEEQAQAKKLAKAQKAEAARAAKEAKKAAKLQKVEDAKQAVLTKKEVAAAQFQQMLCDTEDEALGKLRKRRLTNTILNGITLVSSSVFFICVLEIGWYYLKSYQYQRDMDQLLAGMQGGISEDSSWWQEDFVVENGDVLIFPDEGEYEIVGSTNKFNAGVSDVWLEDYRYLSETNPDCIGWIQIPGTLVDLPVMFTPTDEDKYLYKNFAGEKETRGTPFMAAETKIGKSQNYLIYGHNMKDDMAFGSLDNYLKKSYYKEHKYIYFNTAVSQGIYEVMAVCLTKIYNVDDVCFKYYKYGGELTKKEFETYVREVKKMSEYNTGVNATWGDELITLSTCNRYVENGRLIIVAKRIK